MSKKICNYFIALIPPPEIVKDLWELKVHFRDHYDSKASLNSPPHITLHMPFEWREDREDSLSMSLREFGQAETQFEVGLNNFGCFEPRVIFVEVYQDAALQNFQIHLHRFCKTQLNLFNALYQDRPFHPHITLAFRDLKREAFREAWDQFKSKDFKRRFVADKITLLKHNGSRWEVFTESGLQN